MTSGPLCLPIANGRQASRTGPRSERRRSRLFVAPTGRGNLLYCLFLVLLIVGCSSGQGRLEASTDTVPAEGTEVDTVAWAEDPDEGGQTTEDALPGLESTEVGQAETEPPLEGIALAETPTITEEELTETPLSNDPSTANQPLDQVQRRDEVWEEDGIREEFGEGYTRVVFSEILSEDGYKYSYIDNPPRLVIDVKAPNREVWFNQLSLKGDAFDRIRVGRHPDKIRFVLDLREEGQPQPVVETVETDLVVLATESLDEPSTVEVASAVEESDLEPAPMGGPEVPLTVAKADWKPVRVKGIDYRQTDSASDVIISTDGAVPFDVQELDDSIIVVLPGAQIPEHLQRPIDTKAFPSAILTVRPEQVGAGPTGKVVFTILLREKTPYNVFEEEQGLRVSVLLPETPPEIPLLPPPGSPGDRRARRGRARTAAGTGACKPGKGGQGCGRAGSQGRSSPAADERDPGGSA